MALRVHLCLAAIRLTLATVFNNGTWKLSYPPWNEAGSPMQGKPELFIPIMGPITGHSCMPNRYIAFRIAASHLNRRDATFCPAIGQLQHDFELKYDLRDSHASASGAVLAAMRLMEADTQAGRTVGDADARVKVVLGPNSSPEVAGVYPFLGGAFAIPYLSWAATRGSLGNKNVYPYFFRVVAPDSVTMGVQAGFIHWLGYDKVNILHMEDGYATGQAADFINAATVTYGIEVQKFSIPLSGAGAGSSLNDATRAQALAQLEAIKRTNVRVIGLYGISLEIRDIYLLADQLKMAQGAGWLWFGGDGMAANQFTGNAAEDARLLQLMEGTIYAMADNPSPYWEPFKTAWKAHAPSMDDPEFTVQRVCHGGTICQGRSDFTDIDRAGTRCLNSWLQEAYVAMITMAVVADRLITSTGKAPSDFTKEDWYAGMKTLITTPFTCLSGSMQMSARQERASDVSFLQFHAGGSTSAVEVSRWTATSGYGWIPGVALKWAGGTGYNVTGSNDNVTLPSGRPPTCPAGQAYSQDTLRCEVCPAGYTAFTLDGVAVCTCDLGYGLVGGVCLPCAPGTSKGQAGGRACTACEPGKASGSGARSCQPCGLGTFASQPGQASCTTCAPGYTTAVSGATNTTDCICAVDFYMKYGQCVKCPSGAMTSGIGKTGVNDCLCPKGRFKPKGNPEACEACREGMTCETDVDRRIFGSVERGGLTPAGNYSLEPKLQPSFWSSAEETLVVFRCRNAKSCPGGLPGASACARNLKGRACHHCIDGWVWSGDECTECSSFEKKAFLLPLIFGPIVVIALYKLFADEYKRWNSAGNGCAAIVFILLNHYQIVTLLRGADVEFPPSIVSAWSIIASFSDFTTFMKVECAVSNRFSDVLLVNALGPFVVIAVFAMVWLASVALAAALKRQALKMEFNRTLNSCFSLIFTFFPAIVDTSFSLFTCGLNTSENTATSLIRDRSVICFSDDWNGMLAVGLVSVLVWVCGFGGLLVRTVIISPRWFHSKDYAMRWKFLFIKYRSDVHWWALAWIAKGVLMNLGFVFLRLGIAQVYWVMNVTLFYTMLAMFFSPWRHVLVNFNDIWSHQCIIILCAVLTWFATRMLQDPEEIDADMGRMIVSINVLAIPIAGIVMARLSWLERAPSALAAHHAKCVELRKTLAATAAATQGQFEAFVDSLHEWDFYYLVKAKQVLLQEFMGFKRRSGISSRELQGYQRTSLAGWTTQCMSTQLPAGETRIGCFVDETVAPQAKQVLPQVEDKPEELAAFAVDLPPAEDHIPSCFRSRIIRGVAALADGKEGTSANAALPH